MTAYARVSDVLPCPDILDGRHDWVDSRQSSDQLYSGECGTCAALLIQHWWGWEFFTGEEHFDHSAWSFEEILRVTKPKNRGYLAEDEEQVPMRFDPLPRNIGGNTRAIYRPQDLDPMIDPLRPALMQENFDEGPLVRFLDEPPPANLNILGNHLHRVRGGENWGIYAPGHVRICTNVGEDWGQLDVRDENGNLV